MEQKLNVFQQFAASFQGFADTNKYYQLSRQSTGSKILYTILFGAICWLLLIGVAIFNINTDKELANLVNGLPEFTFYNGELIMDDEINYHDNGNCFYANTSYDNIFCTANEARPNENSVAIDEIIKRYIDEDHATQIIMVSNKNILNIKVAGSQYSYQNITLSEFAGTFNVTSFSKASVVSGYKGMIAKFLMIAGLIILPFSVIGVFLIALLYSFLGAIINATTHANEDFAVIYWMSLYLTIVFKFVGDFLTPIFHSSSLVRAISIAAYVYIMMKILKNGETVVNRFNTGASGHTVLNDDFDNFMKQERQDPFTAARNEANQTAPQEVSNANSYYGSAIQPSQPVKNNNDPFAPSNGSASTESSSDGLSLKIDD